MVKPNPRLASDRSEAGNESSPQEAFSSLPSDARHSALNGVYHHMRDSLRVQAKAPDDVSAAATTRPPLAQPQHALSPAARLMEDWGALGGQLSVALRHGAKNPDFLARIVACAAELERLLLRAPDAALYLLFQLSQSRHNGYSSSHALQCACLCRLMADSLDLPVTLRTSLLHAALTMNVAIADLQNRLAVQAEPLTAAQRLILKGHPLASRLILERAGITDAVWLDVVEHHHAPNPSPYSPRDKLAHLLQVVDRYGACLAARKSRASQSAESSAQTMLDHQSDLYSLENHLFNTIGLYPPGTYVRMQNLEVAVVMQRGMQPHTPRVICVQSPTGRAIEQPELHDTNQAEHAIIESLPARHVHVSLDHEKWLSIALKTAPARAEPSASRAQGLH